MSEPRVQPPAVSDLFFTSKDPLLNSESNAALTRNRALLLSRVQKLYEQRPDLFMLSPSRSLLSQIKEKMAPVVEGVFRGALKFSPTKQVVETVLNSLTSK